MFWSAVALATVFLALAEEECASSGCQMSSGTALIQRAQDVEKSTDDYELESVKAPPAVPPPAPEGFSGPMKGYCKLAEGSGPENSPYGLGVVQKESVEACGAHCTDIQSPRACRGFNYAPGVHQDCHLFGEHPEVGTGSWGWQCYTRNLVVAKDVPDVEEGVTCQDSNDGAEDKERQGCEFYSAYPGSCGDLDDDDFTASSMCCACADAEIADAAQGPQVCKSWCYSEKHADHAWSGDSDLKYNKCDWRNCMLCPECAAHAESK